MESVTLMYLYRAYRLIFESEFPIPEFLPAEEANAAPDVRIRYGAVPPGLENPAGRGVLYQADASQFLLALPDLARYLVQNGSEIVVEPQPGSLESDVRVFLLGSCIGALLHQRGHLVLHAGAIRTPGGAALFSGPSGCGKSTLIGEFLRRGYPMMVDDVCALVLDPQGLPLVLPGYPRTRLWSDAAAQLEQDVSALPRTRPSLEKYERQVADQFWDSPAGLRRIYLLTANNQDVLRLSPLPRVNAFKTVLRNTYRQQFLDGLEMRAAHFDLAAAVARQASIVHVSRPSQPFRLRELADLIEQDLA
jgi:hypothetical protein